MRKTKRQSVDSAVAAAWEKVFAETEPDDLAGYEAEGWMTALTAGKRAKTNPDNVRKKFDRLHKSGRMDCKKIRVMHGNTMREVNIYRPRI